jgi:hypothetical protein
MVEHAAVNRRVGGSKPSSGAKFSNTLDEGNDRSLSGKATALYAVVIQFESESSVEVVTNVLTLIDIENYNLTRL